MDSHLIASNYPDFIIVGAGKSGTTSLQKYLKSHSKIFMPEQKELWFLQLNKNPNKEILKRLSVPTTIEHYTQMFQNSGANKLKGEATPSYLMFPEYTIATIKEHFPEQKKEPKIIIILREPMDKILSQYRFNLLLGTETLSFNQALEKEEERHISNNSSIGFDYVRSTLYAQQITCFKEAFSHVGVFLFDKLKSSPSELMKDICKFLEIEFETQYNSDSFFKSFNSSNISLLGWRKKIKLGLWKSILISFQLFSLTSIMPLWLNKRTSFLRYKDTQKEDISFENLQNLKRVFREEITQLETITQLNLKTWLRNYD